MENINFAKFTALGILLSFALSSCYKSDRPIEFQGHGIESVTSTALGYTVGLIDSKTNQIDRAYQLRTEGDTTFLHMCPYRGESERPMKAEVLVHSIPEQSGFYVISLEDGNFLLKNSNPGHEFYVLRPLRDRMQVSGLDERESHNDAAYRYFKDITPLASNNGSETHSTDLIKDFLVKHVDEWWASLERNSVVSEYKYFNFDLTSCDFSR